MHYRNLRHHLLAGAARLILTIEGEGGDGAGGAPAAAAPAAPTPEAPAAEAPAAAAPSEAPAAEAPPAGDDPGGEPEPKPSRVPWQTKRIDTLTAQAREAQEQAARLAEENRQAQEQIAAYQALYGAAAAPAGGAPPPPPPAGDRTYTQSELQQEAARIASLNALNQACETLFDQGATSHKDTWATRVSQAGQAFGNELKQRPDFFEALTVLPNGADVYHELTGDLDHLAEVLAMPQLKLGMEMAKMSAKLAAARAKGPAVSKVPAPIEPIDGSGGGDNTDLAKVPMDVYARTRETQREARMKARGY